MNGDFARSNRRFACFYAKKRFVSDDSAARNGRTASVSAIECRVVQPAGGESVGVAPHRRCTVRNGAGLRPTLKVKVWAAQPAPRASVRCPLPPSVVWVFTQQDQNPALGAVHSLRVASGFISRGPPERLAPRVLRFTGAKIPVRNSHCSWVTLD